MKPTLTILVGISASGKSTKVKELAIDNKAIIVSSDAIRGEFGEVINQSNNNEVFKLFHHRIKVGLTNGYNVIADATNITIKSRKQIFETVKNINCEVIGYVMTKPIDKCIEDNIYREYPVPHHVIMKQMIPFYEEGFDKIIINDYESEYVDDDFIRNSKKLMDGFNQNNPHHNEDLLGHCKTVFEGLGRLTTNHMLLQSALLHDIGKLFTQKTDENGISHYYQHENVGCYYLLSNIL